MSTAVDIFEDVPNARSTHDEMFTTSKRRKKRRSRSMRSSRKRTKSSWDKMLAKHRPSRSDFTYKDQHYTWGERSNGFAYPMRVGSKRSRSRAMPTRRFDDTVFASDSDSFVSESSVGSASDDDFAFDDEVFTKRLESDTRFPDYNAFQGETFTTRKQSQDYGPYEFSNLYHRHDASEPPSLTVPKETITVRKMNTAKGPRYQAAADVQGGPHNREYHLRKFISRATAKKYHNYPHGNGHPAEHFSP